MTEQTQPLVPAPTPVHLPESPSRRPSPGALGWALPAYLVLWWFVWVGSLLQMCILLAGSLAVYVALVRLSEHRAVSELRGGVRAAGEGVLGVGIGAAVFALGLAAVLATGIVSLVGVVDARDFTVVPSGILMLVAVVVFEELLYRGIILRYAELWLGSWLALGLSSLLFALAHFWAGPLSAEAFVERLAVGVLLGSGYLLTRRLWLPMGVHLGLNLGSALVFGWEGVLSQVPLLTAHGSLVWVPLARAAIATVMACVLLAIASKRGRVVNSYRAWQLQSSGG